MGEREYVYATIQPGWKVKGGTYTDRNQLLQAISTLGEPYSVELKLKNSVVYAYFTVEEIFPKSEITKSNGVIGIDTNAYPKHMRLVKNFVFPIYNVNCKVGLCC